MFRDLALHDHFPFEEFYGKDRIDQTNIFPKHAKPKNTKRAKKINEANMTLIDAGLRGRRHGLIEALSAQKALSDRKKKRNGR